MGKYNKILIVELIQDLPLWVALIMGIFPKYQNEKVFFASLFLGTLASIYIVNLIRKGQYGPEIVEEETVFSFSFLVYGIALIVVLVIASFKGLLYMKSFALGYLIVFSSLELIFFLKSKDQTD